MRALNKGVLGGSIGLLMLAVLFYAYEVTVIVPYGKEYPLRNLSFVLGLLGILAFGAGVALPSRHRRHIASRPSAHDHHSRNQ